MSFNDAEIAYLGSQPVARLATLGDGGQPDVVPVAFEFDGTFFWVGGRRLVGPRYPQVPQRRRRRRARRAGR